MSSPNLLETTEFRRFVTSQICSDTSAGIDVIVYPKIKDNYVVGGVNQFECFNSSADIIGSVASGGKPEEDYTYFWEASIDQLSWVDAAGDANSKDYTSVELTSPEYYRRIIHSGEEAQ